MVRRRRHRATTSAALLLAESSSRDRSVAEVGVMAGDGSAEAEVAASLGDENAPASGADARRCVDTLTSSIA